MQKPDQTKKAEKGGSASPFITGERLKKFFSYLIHGRFRAAYSGIKNVMYANRLLHELPLTDFAEWTENNTVATPFIPEVLYSHTVDIVIPVYNGYEYLEQLFSTITHTKMRYRLFIVDDHSTDARIRPYLLEYVQSVPDSVLICNEQNLGFVQSVNLALSKTRNHVALLNTDIILPPLWLERLVAPIILTENIASSTPFTNSGTICSFPYINRDNALFEGFSFEKIDKSFQSVTPFYTRLPTGVGFCMGLNRKALKDVGLLDAKTFSRGYGEENDWCQRAIKAGYSNVLVENLFVWHKHGGSFLSEEKRSLMENNLHLLLQKYPTYGEQVADFSRRDPAKTVREYVMLQLLSGSGETVVYFDHDIGGGAGVYMDHVVKQQLESGGNVCIIRYSLHEKRYLFEFHSHEYVLTFGLGRFEDVKSIIAFTHARVVCINELVTYPNVYAVLDHILEWKREYGFSLVMLLHDYYCICPGVNLIDRSDCYCAIPPLEICEACMPENDMNCFREYKTMADWRKNWQEFLYACDQILTFSHSSAILLEKAYGTFDTLAVQPHVVDYLPMINKERKVTSSLNIGVIGNINIPKGLSILKGLLHIIEREKMNVRVILMGITSEPLKSPPLC